MENYTKLNSKPVVEDPKEPWDIYVGSGSKVKVVISKALKILEVFLLFFMMWNTIFDP